MNPVDDDSWCLILMCSELQNNLNWPTKSLPNMLEPFSAIEDVRLTEAKSAEYFRVMFDVLCAAGPPGSNFPEEMNKVST